MLHLPRSIANEAIVYLEVVVKIGRCVGLAAAGGLMPHGLCLDGDLKSFLQMPLCMMELSGNVRSASFERLKHYYGEIWSFESTDTYKATGERHQCPERLMRPLHPAYQMDNDSQESISLLYTYCSQGRQNLVWPFKVEIFEQYLLLLCTQLTIHMETEAQRFCIAYDMQSQEVPGDCHGDQDRRAQCSGAEYAGKAVAHICSLAKSTKGCGKACC